MAGRTSCLNNNKRRRMSGGTIADRLGDLSVADGAVNHCDGRPKTGVERGGGLAVDRGCKVLCIWVPRYIGYMLKCIHSTRLVPERGLCLWGAAPCFPLWRARHNCRHLPPKVPSVSRSSTVRYLYTTTLHYRFAHLLSHLFANYVPRHGTIDSTYLRVLDVSDGNRRAAPL